MRRKRGAGAGILLFFFLMAVSFVPVLADTGQTGDGQEEEDMTLMIDDSLLSQMDLQEVQEAVDSLLGGTGFSVSDSVRRLANGEDVFSGTGMKEQAFSLIKQAFAGQRELWLRILILVLAAALLLKNFQVLSSQIASALEGILGFMKALVPAYYLAIATASGASSAAMFYQIVLIAISLVENLLVYLILPGIQIYVLISLVNQLSKEDFLSHMAELLKSCISWIMKTALGLVIGMQVTRNLISPALDSLRRTVIGKTASAIPVVGDAIDSVTEMVIGSAVLIRNCVGLWRW